MTVSELRTLVDNLEEYIHVPGGIDRLKKMVLHLAVTGQLVPQDPLEGTGEDLYREIQDEKEVLVRQGRIKKQKTLPEINSDATPFVIPESWKWARLANVTIFSIGRTPSRSESKYWNSDYMPWVSIADLRANSHIGTTKEKISKEAYEKCFGGVAVPAGSLLYSFKLTIGKMSIIDMDAVHNEAIASFATINPIFTEYLFKALGVIDPTARTNSAVMGKTLNSATLSLLEIPLPPLGEQKRIVAKVDSVFALIDQLAEVYKSEQAERSKLVASSLAKLAKGEDGVEDSLALTNLSEIIRTKADAKILRQTILHLAVSGQLVPQDLIRGHWGRALPAN
jgi:type I restriction enzyme S subunit